MFKIHNYYNTDKYFIIPPTGYLATSNSHSIEAAIMGMELIEYYKYLKKEYRSIRLIKYQTFLSYSLNQTDAKRLLGTLNKAFKRLNKGD